jgi:hypothetical protein
MLEFSLHFALSSELVVEWETIHFLREPSFHLDVKPP